jgi:uncharacterized membrane protein required for colicin V production
VIRNPNLTLSQTVILGIILVVFAYMGFRRGANRALFSIVGIILGILVSRRLASMLAPWVNRFYRLGRFALSGGLFSDNPAAAWGEASSLPNLVRTTLHQQVLELVTFFTIVFIFYLIGRRNIPLAKTWTLKVLGLLAGAINGFVVAYYLSPYLLNVTQTTIVLPSQELRTTLTAKDNIALALFVFVAVMIAFGLYNAHGSRRR